MPAGRDTKYKPARGVAVVYGLCDGSGTVFYVGSSRDFPKRMAAYAGGRFHGNCALAERVGEVGLHWVILEEGPEDLLGAEYAWISKLSELVNIVTEDLPWHRVPSRKPWVVQGTRWPTVIYKTFMKSAFGDDCEWLDVVSGMNDADRMDVERRFAERFAGNRSLSRGMARWMRAVEPV